ncbi:HNH endonuclease signature motif containing protein [Streptomyces chiangmaiensis]|uniref:HNH endonuclease signature motif containing protein n=1 Tax=Streptomyces chiangmaiensis TaxID=766497 RepID=A0ABU7FLF0_9ACTN|nr:HNH endonuclease signature motif containing protein [Streptomyces chiangmaiensis]MED7824878.1 HNH endonuclease signature motif containing protein [Streptomyces chiangmaiensis]
MTASRYTRELLSATAASSRTLSETLEKLGVDPKGPSRRYLRDRMRKFGVDTSHFERETGARWTKEILESAVAASTSVNGVLRYLGIEVVGGHHTNISRRIKAYGIDTSHFRRQSQVGVPRQRWSPEGLLVEQEPSLARRQPSNRLKRAMIALGAAEQCALCGREPFWRSRPLPLEVDHLDGNWRNNRLENLRLLCPNCHSATDTYRGRNKGRRT